MAVTDIGMKNNGFKKKSIIKMEPLSLWNEKRSVSAVYLFTVQSKHAFVGFFFSKDSTGNLSVFTGFACHREAMFKLVDLEGFPALRVWARPRLTSSHVAAKLKLPTKLSASPCTHISRQWAGTQLSSSPFLLSPQVLLIDGRET